MHLYFHSENNFGDQLNEWMWPRLFGCEIEVLEPKDALFVGIGTILRPILAEIPKKKYVFGSGCGYERPPTLDDRWHFDFVRGPLSAKALGLQREQIVTDPAVMVRKFFRKNKVNDRQVGFIPHYATATLCCFQEVCAELNIKYIDSRRSYTEVIPEISKCSLVITEAMHGAIIADALRVPWISVKSRASILAFKWQDWAESLNLTNSLYLLPPLYASGLKKVISNNFTGLVKRRLRHLASCPGILSSDKILDEACFEIERRIELLKMRKAQA